MKAKEFDEKFEKGGSLATLTYPRPEGPIKSNAGSTWIFPTGWSIHWTKRPKN